MAKVLSQLQALISQIWFHQPTYYSLDNSQLVVPVARVMDMASVRRLLSILLTIFIAFSLRLPIPQISTASAGSPTAESLRIVEASTSFQLEGISYMANTRNLKASLRLEALQLSSLFGRSNAVPLTILRTNESIISERLLQDIVESHLVIDDVFSTSFLQAVYISSAASAAVIQPSALSYLTSLGTKTVFHDKSMAALWLYSSLLVSIIPLKLPPGPYLATQRGKDLGLAEVYRLYEDRYRTFLYGTYEVGDGSGSHKSTNICLASGCLAIPVPSRLYSIDDSRPLAGYRVAVKDLFDIKGLVTSAGSHALANISSPAERTAPAIQHIVDLGGVIVGKQKLAQFGSGADPWNWEDEQPPFNPRGDGWLTCSASSSGGGCAIAAYDWLDFAVGTDTGCSMRRPAAVSGTYGQRPSQGMMSLENVIPQGGATDTAGVFARDPKKWVQFSKAWYASHLVEGPEKTGLAPISVPDSYTFPRTILYPTDYLRLSNPSAQFILNAFIANLTAIFGMTIKRINFTATIEEASDPAVADLRSRNRDILDILDYHPHWEELASYLIRVWAQRYNGSFPPIDPAYRDAWLSWNASGSTMTQYNEALRLKRRSVGWYEQNMQYSFGEMCSNSIMIYDIGTGGLPSYREKHLNHSPNASFLAVVPEGTVMAGAGICPLYGCVDFTLPIGQVPYWSPVSLKEETIPVSVNVVAKRGCDFMLYNMVDALVERGVFQTVMTGKTAF